AEEVTDFFFDVVGQAKRSGRNYRGQLRDNRLNTRGGGGAARAHVPAVLFGSGVTRLREQHLNDPRLNQRPGFQAKAREHPDCVTDYGVYDVVGNLQEWVADDVNSA